MIVYIFKNTRTKNYLSLKLLKFSKSGKMRESAWRTCPHLKLFAHKMFGQK